MSTSPVMFTARPPGGSRSPLARLGRSRLLILVALVVAVIVVLDVTRSDEEPGADLTELQVEADVIDERSAEVGEGLRAGSPTLDQDLEQEVAGLDVEGSPPSPQGLAQEAERMDDRVEKEVADLLNQLEERGP